jgi:hypothetical protein
MIPCPAWSQDSPAGLEKEEIKGREKRKGREQK